jgi:hypothetical protein
MPPQHGATGVRALGWHIHTSCLQQARAHSRPPPSRGCTHLTFSGGEPSSHLGAVAMRFDDRWQSLGSCSAVRRPPHLQGLPCAEQTAAGHTWAQRRHDREPSTHLAKPPAPWPCVRDFTGTLGVAPSTPISPHMPRHTHPLDGALDPPPPLPLPLPLPLAPRAPELLAPLLGCSAVDCFDDLPPLRVLLPLLRLLFSAR